MLKSQKSCRRGIPDNDRLYRRGAQERRKNNNRRFWHILSFWQKGKKGQKPPDRQRDQDCRKESTEVYRWCSIKGSGKRKGSCKKGSKEGTGQTEEEINQVNEVNQVQEINYDKGSLSTLPEPTKENIQEEVKEKEQVQEINYDKGSLSTLPEPTKEEVK